MGITDISIEELARKAEEQRDRVAEEKKQQNATASETRPSDSESYSSLCRRCGTQPPRTIEALGRLFNLGTCGPCSTEEEREERERNEAIAEQARKQDMAVRRANIIPLLAAAGVNVFNYSHAELGTFDPNPDREALTVCRNYVRSYIRGERFNVYLHGERPGETIAPGNGKTFLAIAMLRAVLLHDPRTHHSRVRFAYMPDVFARLKATFAPDAKSTEAEVLASYERPDILVLDDIGLNGWTDWKIEQTAQLLNRRAGKATIYTGNYTPGEMALSAPPDFARIYSRLTDRTTLVTLRGPDRRGPVA